MSTAALRDGEGRLIGGVEMFRDLSEVAELRRKLLGTYVCEDIITKSNAMQGVREILPLVARSDSTVLIEGEPGTGKELVARAIHNLGPRRERPFVAVNCGAIPDTLVESELFGHLQGAFTDAKRDKPGRFAVAEGGSLSAGRGGRAVAVGPGQAPSRAAGAEVHAAGRGRGDQG